MNLYLAQHGQAVSKEVDPDRPLSKEGRGDVIRVAGFLQGRLQVSRILHSGKTRARQTAELLADALTPGRAVQEMAGLNPKDPVAPVAASAGEALQDALLVGHLPFMAGLISQLVSGEEALALVDYTPGSVVGLLEEEGGWRIQWMIRPDLLPA